MMVESIFGEGIIVLFTLPWVVCGACIEVSV